MKGPSIYAGEMWNFDTTTLTEALVTMRAFTQVRKDLKESEWFNFNVADCGK